MRELCENLSHLVPALTASDVNNDLSVRPLGQLLLSNGLAASEWSRDTSGTTLSQREEEVEDPLACDERYIRCVLLHEWSGRSHRPLLHHRDLGAIFERAYSLGDIEFTRLDTRDDSTLSRWNHDTVLDGLGLLHDSNDGTSIDLIASGSGSVELPLLRQIETVGVDTTFDEDTHCRFEVLQRSLDSIVNLR